MKILYNHNSGVYEIRNLVNNKHYIGSSIDLQVRSREHINKLKTNKHDNPKLQNAFNKYGDIFAMVILEECSKDVVLAREQHYIDTTKPWYNILRIAGRTLGHKHSKKTKAKMSKIKKAQYAAGFKVWNVGIAPTQIVKDKISKSLGGRFTGVNHPFYNRTHTIENKRLMVEASHRRKGTHHTGHKGRVFQLDKVTLEVLHVYSSAPHAASYLRIKGSKETAGNKIGESVRYNRNAYGFKWLFERDLDQVKVEELLESLRSRSISSRASGKTEEGSETRDTKVSPEHPQPEMVMI